MCSTLHKEAPKALPAVRIYAPWLPDDLALAGFQNTTYAKQAHYNNGHLLNKIDPHHSREVDATSMEDGLGRRTPIKKAVLIFEAAAPGPARDTRSRGGLSSSLCNFHTSPATEIADAIDANVMSKVKNSITNFVEIEVNVYVSLVGADDLGRLFRWAKARGPLRPAQSVPNCDDRH